MDARLIKTDGYGLEAEIEIANQRLIVMDAFSDLESPANSRLLRNVELLPQEIEGLPWEETFSGNPEKRSCLEQIDGWRYFGYGKIIRINPTMVDFGLIISECGPRTNDVRCVGEFIKVLIDRLDCMEHSAA